MTPEELDAMPPESSWYWCEDCQSWFAIGEWECEHVNE
jgi:hypothetical protein